MPDHSMIQLAKSEREKENEEKRETGDEPKVHTPGPNYLDSRSRAQCVPLRGAYVRSYYTNERGGHPESN